LDENLESALNASYERHNQNVLQLSLDYEQLRNTLKQKLQELTQVHTENSKLREELTKLKTTPKAAKN